MKTLTRLQKSAISHYDTMIIFAENQPGRNVPSLYYMLRQIGKTWKSDSCPYCKKYKDICDNCFLGTSNGILNELGCCGGLWNKMNAAKTWKTWVKYAKLIREYIIEHGSKNAKASRPIE